MEHQSLDTRDLEDSQRKERLKHQGVDTQDLEKGIKGLNIVTPADPGLAGKGEDQWLEMEAGVGEKGRTRDNIPGGWETIWLEDPWTGKWEQVRVSQEEAESRQRKGLPQ